MAKNTYKILRNQLFNIIVKQPFTDIKYSQLIKQNTFKEEFLLAYPIFVDKDFKYGMVLLRGHTLYNNNSYDPFIRIINNNRMYLNNIIDYNLGKENLYLSKIYHTDKAYIGNDCSFSYSNKTFKLILDEKILKIYDFLVNYNISHNRIIKSN